MSEPRHCDLYIGDPAAHPALRAYLERARGPSHGHMSDAPYPKLFATYRGEAFRDLAPGARVRVVMASRMGDVGVTERLDASSGYDVRVSVESLADFSEVP